MMLMVMMMLMIKRRSSDEERRLPRRRSLGGGETRSFSAPNFLQILLVSCKSCEFPSTLSSNQRRRDEVFSCSISKSPLSNSASKLMYMYVVVGFRSLRFNAKNVWVQILLTPEQLSPHPNVLEFGHYIFNKQEEGERRGRGNLRDCGKKSRQEKN